MKNEQIINIKDILNEDSLNRFHFIMELIMYDGLDDIPPPFFVLMSILKTIESGLIKFENKDAEDELLFLIALYLKNDDNFIINKSHISMFENETKH